MSLTGRRLVVFALIAFGFFGILCRVVDLHVIQRQFLMKQSEARIRRVVSIPAHRGIITDRAGKPLAISAQVFSAWANPKGFSATPQQLAELATLVEMPSDKLKQRIEAANARAFVYLKRSLTPVVAEKIRALNIQGVFLQPEYKRFYPEADVTAHVIGLTNIDDRGQEGMELAYDNWLRGVPGKKEVIKDRVGNIISELSVIRQPEEGHNLTLTIDSRIQYLAYQALNEAITKYSAQSGSVVVLDVTNGDILAMVNSPSYNPNNLISIDEGKLRNRAVTDQFEPGSTMKAFGVASFIKSGKFTPESVIHTSPGWINVNGNIIHDHSDYGDLSVVDILKKSSNVGMTKMALQTSPQALWDLLHNLGFGERTTSGYPGEAMGSLVVHPIWRPIDVATMSFGYGMAVTPLQLAQAYATIANGGVRHPVRLVQTEQKFNDVEVLDKKTADQVMMMLEQVVSDKEGTGKLANIQGYRVAGKTGTAYISGPHGYDRMHYHSSFIGIAPMTNPRLVVLVMIKNPQQQHYGAIVAAPAFAKIMAGALRLLAVAPDNLPVTTSIGNGYEK